MDATTSTAPGPQVRATSVPRHIAVGYLRAFVTAMVVAHHAVLAYHPFAPPPHASLAAQPRWWQAFPVVDSQRWTGFSLFVGFNDTFFMSLMFFLSGLFVWHSLRRKGAGKFVRDRLLRLGVPFVLAAALIAPLAYYPTYLQMATHGDFAGFWRQWFALGGWPAGPAWFVWVLLAFGCVAALLYRVMPTWGERLGRVTSGAALRPAAFFALLCAVSAAVYLPMVLVFSPLQWTGFGPFTFQTSRILLYLAYFLIGAGVGAQGIDRDLLASDGKLARHWLVWVLGALGAFGLAVWITVATITSHLGSQLWIAIGGFSFVLSCAASSFAMLAIFLRFARSRVPLWDSLGDNAYGIYLVHYAFVSWLQYAMLAAPLGAPAKGGIVFLAALAMSWCAAALLRRVPAIARVI